MEKRVVITGMGIWACIGKNTEEVTQSLREGRSGIGLDPARRELGYISSLTGIVEQPNLKGVLDRRKRLCLPQQGEYAYMATAEAMRNAGMDEAYLAANEVGIIYGNDSSAAPVIEGIDIIRARRNTAMVGSGNIFQSMNSTVTMNLSVIFNLRGINLTLSAACASGVARHRHGLPDDQAGVAGARGLRRRTGGEPLLGGQLRRAGGILGPRIGSRGGIAPLRQRPRRAGAEPEARRR